MNITEIEGVMVRLPTVERIGDGCQNILIILVHTDEGITGIGEAHTNPLVNKAVLDAPLCSVSAEGLRSLLIGENPLHIGRLWDKMNKHTQTYGRRGVVMHVISGIDLALWDILGKAAGMPVHQLLGGARHQHFDVYASDLSQPTLEATLDRARRHKENGYKAVKFGWGDLGDDPRRDVKKTAEMRNVLGDDIDIMIDMGFAVPLEDAIFLGRAFADYGVYFLEEPLSPDDLDGFAKLTAVSPTPIATGEKESTVYAYRDLMERGGLRIIQPDIARVGGISEAMRIAALAEARGVRMIPHCWSTDILVSATLQVIATLRDCPYLEYNVTDNPLRTDLLIDPLRPTKGRIEVPTGPGLGIELNPDTIEKYRWEG